MYAKRIIMARQNSTLSVNFSGEEIRAIRLELGLTPDEFATLLGYGARNRISEIENGKKQISGAVALLIRAYRDGYRPPDWPEGK